MKFLGAINDNEDITTKEYVDENVGGASTPYSQSFTATLSQTNFTLSHVPVAAWVWVNGAIQDSSTWSISTNDIVLSTGLIAGDTVKVYYLTSVGVANSGIMSLVEDTTPKLGGNLDLNTNTVGNATDSDLTKLHSITASYSEINILTGATLSTTELNYVDGVTSNIQTQLNTKLTASGASKITVSTTAPSTPSAGDLWVDIN